MEGFQEEQQEAPTDAYLTDDGTSYVIVPETEGAQVDYEKAERLSSRRWMPERRAWIWKKKMIYRKPGITRMMNALNGEMAD